MKSQKGVLIGAGCGLLVGIAMATPMGILRLPHFAETIWGMCNYPAALAGQGFFMLWQSIGLGPHGDAGWAILIVAMGVAIIIQWGLVGAIVGLLVVRRYFKLVAAICGALGITVLGIVFWLVVGQWLFMDPTVAKFRRMGGGVTVDEFSQNKPIVEVRLTGPQVNDASLAQLKGLEQLRNLGLSFCPNVTGAGLANIRGLNKLTEITFGYDGTDVWLEQLEGMTQLRSLRLTCSKSITDKGLEHLKGLLSLQTLDLEFCTGITDAGIAHLKGLMHLKNLCMRGTKIGDDGLAHLAGLAELESLNLDECLNVTDRGLEHLKGLANLKSLSVMVPHGNVTSTKVDELKTAIPNLTVLGVFASRPLGLKPDDSKPRPGRTFGNSVWPAVVQTVPKSGDRNVDPSLKEIRVTYNKKMKDGSWSWGGDAEQIGNGEPHYLNDGKTCVLPVKLEPGKTYTIPLNSRNSQDFKDATGHPASPYVLQFNTRQ